MHNKQDGQCASDLLSAHMNRNPSSLCGTRSQLTWVCCWECSASCSSKDVASTACWCTDACRTGLSAASVGRLPPSRSPLLLHRTDATGLYLLEFMVAAWGCRLGMHAALCRENTSAWSTAPRLKAEASGRERGESFIIMIKFWSSSNVHTQW